MQTPHVVRKALSNGVMVTYTYAFRGGPRVACGVTHPNFDEMRQCAIDDWYRKRQPAVGIDRFTRSGIHDFKTSMLSRLVRNARCRAAGRKLDCDLSVMYLKELLVAQDMKCAVSGLPFDLTANLDRKHSRNPFGPSLDRIDNSKGYMRGNVRIVLSAVNYAINEWGEDQYRTICAAVVGSETRHTR
jgi:hypothetical protein